MAERGISCHCSMGMATLTVTIAIASWMSPTYQTKQIPLSFYLTSSACDCMATKGKTREEFWLSGVKKPAQQHTFLPVHPTLAAA
jgi:hypothetical protein